MAIFKREWFRDPDLPIIWAILYLVCFIWKPIVSLLLWLRHGRKSRIMDPFDGLQSELFCAPRHVNHINPTFVMEGQGLKPEQLRRKFERMLQDDYTFGKLKLSKALFLGYWSWIPAKDFDLDYHIRFSEIKYNDRCHLARLLTELREKEPCFPPHVSPWAVQVFYSADGTETALNVHSDHSIMDGFALFQVFIPALADSFPAEAVLELPLEPRLRSGWKVFLERFSDRIDAGRHIRGDPDVNPIKALVEEKGLPSSIGLWSDRIPVQKLKRLAKKWNTSINTLFMACYSAALDDVMEKIHRSSDRAESYQGNLRISCINTYSNWHTGCPRKLRNEFLATAEDIPSRFIPDGMERPKELGLPERIRFLDSRKEATIQRLEFVWTACTILSHVSFRYIRWASSWGLGHRLASPFTAVHTNALTYDGEIDICGQKVKDIVGFMPKLYGIGPSSLLFSYNGNAIFGILGDGCLFSTQDEVRDFIQDVMSGFRWLEDS